MPGTWCGCARRGARSARSTPSASGSCARTRRSRSTTYRTGRSEIRDFVDVLHLDDSYLPLGALAWAACGKDPGFTPDFLLDHAARHVAYTQVDSI